MAFALSVANARIVFATKPRNRFLFFRDLMAINEIFFVHKIKKPQ
jgi:hypothetical protein